MNKEAPEYKVTNEKDHANLLAQVDALMRKGENNVTAKESEEIRQIGIALQAYELQIYPISAPRTTEGRIELDIYEMRLQQQHLYKN